MKQLSRIEAVNRILKMKTGERVSTNEELNDLPQAVEAGDELDYATTAIQVDFKWFYNSIINGQLTSDNNGEVTLPDNLSYLTIHSTDAPVMPPWLRPVGGKLYDTYNHTTNLGVGKTVRYSGKLVWDFEDLPVAFQMLAIAYARKEIAGGGSHFSPTRLARETDAFNGALQTAMKFDDSLNGGPIRNPMSNRRTPPGNDGWLGI